MADPAPAVKPPLSPNALGAVWMLGSALGFVVMAVLAKGLGATTSVAMLIFWRSLAGVIAVLPFAVMAGPSVWKTTRPGKLLLRSSYGTIGFFAGFYALVHLPLAQSQALSFSRTLFMTILAVIVLREKVAWRRWTAVGIGFAGILLMTRPDFSAHVTAFDPATLAALISALAFAFALVTVKDLTRDHSPLTLVVYGNIATTLAGLPFLFMDPVLPDLKTMGLLIAMGFAGVVAQSCYVRALSTGEASLMGLIDYIRLPLVAVAGLIFFHEVPDTLAMVGAAIVIISTIYITLRDAKTQSVKPPGPPPA
ncbi:riboflavin transporter [Candidatus Phycosocius bacilliformis]|uniref:Riboflavin transporter n=1 Tax=Candidatus Phycosocius bacilliformis TaxID=1445552 RepID=A0A2P2EB15_9PROT|nr:DMT family transporter [Candidatus Phycosocius bacilliformis]GBF58244.1 riboflavin transporter [Candidatus Phycosocius bacilliformis]